MKCPKCGQENPETVQFCRRCHAPLRITCPACQHAQARGEKCEACGVDFAKYAMILGLQMKTQATQERERVRSRGAVIKQILLLPITGGFSLLKFIRDRLRGE
ncbi:MAG: hypothetical protein DMG23_12720 [Acidobacteria bacterium]|nr:MAG: hypothetical protein DMG23_12720 [Acidobacteriota bacterium]